MKQTVSKTISSSRVFKTLFPEPQGPSKFSAKSNERPLTNLYSKLVLVGRDNVIEYTPSLSNICVPPKVQF